MSVPNVMETHSMFDISSWINRLHKFYTQTPVVDQLNRCGLADPLSIKTVHSWSKIITSGLISLDDGGENDSRCVCVGFFYIT